MIVAVVAGYLGSHALFEFVLPELGEEGRRLQPAGIVVEQPEDKDSVVLQHVPVEAVLHFGISLLYSGVFSQFMDEGCAGGSGEAGPQPEEEVDGGEEEDKGQPPPDEDEDLLVEHIHLEEASVHHFLGRIYLEDALNGPVVDVPHLADSYVTKGHLK